MSEIVPGTVPDEPVSGVLVERAPSVLDEVDEVECTGAVEVASRPVVASPSTRTAGDGIHTRSTSRDVPASGCSSACRSMPRNSSPDLATPTAPLWTTGR